MVYADTMKRFEDKVALVTGAASGIGLQTSRMFSEEGAKVAVVDINEAQAAKAAEEIGGGAKAFKCDVSDYDSVQAMVKAVGGEYGRIDIVFNNAGIAPRASIEEMTIDHWRKVHAIDLDSVLFVSKEALPYLKRSNGCIVNTASMCSIGAWPKLAAYTSAKSAVLMLTKEMAVELKEYGIRANAVLPGVVETPLHMNALKDAGTDMSKIDTSKFQQPADIARAVLFFADSANGQISGNFLVINGVSSFI
jgi:meso-butanediol dehydrogenase/(S,S)-butanediol dehydrogenase/diacetyl reductase